MHRLDFSLACSIMLSALCCGRTSLDTVVAGAGRAISLGGAAASGGAPAAGGATGAGGSTSAADGSVSTTDLDTCSSDADCLTSCIWTTAPENSSHCTAFYCCSNTWLSKKRCEANQAAWASYCPNQSPKREDCPCLAQCLGEVFACVGGRCAPLCPIPVGG
jgi:hypothetical protein